MVKLIPLEGLKENVIVGHRIPAGTGDERLRQYYRRFQKEEDRMEQRQEEIMESLRKEELSFF